MVRSGIDYDEMVKGTVVSPKTRAGKRFGDVRVGAVTGVVVPLAEKRKA